MQTIRMSKLSTFKRRMLAGAAVLAMVGSVLAPIGAHAEDNGPSGVPGKSCAIEVDGQIQQVPVGTHVGILYCGRDGDWHIGWLVDELVSTQPTQPRVPVVKVTAATFARLAPQAPTAR